jgi:TfoX/Sxy family transcriptional regulator of competence genes
MATKQSTAEYLADQMSGAGAIRVHKMFGEYAVYCNEKIVALICDEQLFVKPTVSGKALIGSVQESPPYPGAKPYFLITGDECEDREFLCSLIMATAKELPEPKKKKKK